MRAWFLLVMATAALATAQPQDEEGRGHSPLALEESDDAWLARASGFRFGFQLAAGLSTLVGFPVTFGFGKVSLYAIPQIQFQWPLLYTTAVLFAGIDVGLRVHLVRRFSFGAGAMFGFHLGDLRLVGGFSLTPVMVHLGDREQHTLLITVPVLFNYFNVAPLAMVGYEFRFN